MARSDHGIVKDKMGQEQPKDKERARLAHTTDPNKPASHEAARKPASPNKHSHKPKPR